jgi:hypothetical protein
MLEWTPAHWPPTWVLREHRFCPFHPEPRQSRQPWTADSKASMEAALQSAASKGPQGCPSLSLSWQRSRQRTATLTASRQAAHRQTYFSRREKIGG